MGTKVTLKELIESSHGNYQVKIGTKSGSGFLWCGSTSDLKGNWGQLESVVVDKHKERLKKAKAHLNGLFTECPTVGKYAKSHYKFSGTFGTFEDYMAHLPDYFKELEDAKDKIKKCEQRLAKLVPMQNREVYRVDKSTIDPNCAIILVYGSEVGMAWDKEEFDAWKREREDAERDETEEEDK